MELKSVMVDGKPDGERGSNRTFMELKCNSEGRHHDQGRRSNRTFMELKYYIN